MKPWETLDAFLDAKGVEVGAPTEGQTDGGDHTSGSAHYVGRGRDYGRTSDRAAVALALKSFCTPTGPIMELFYEGDSVKVWLDNGRPFIPNRTLRKAHESHVHVALWPGRVMPSISQPETPAPAEPATSTEDDMIQYEWPNGAIVSVNAAGEAFCPALPGRPVARHFGGMPNLREDAKRAFDGKVVCVAGIDRNNSDAGYVMLDSSWGKSGEIYKFEPGVEKFFK